MPEPKDRILWHQSGINVKGEPFVQFFSDDELICHLTPEQARDHAMAILEASEASEQDAFIFEFFQQKVGMDAITVGRLIIDFRKWREEKGKKGPPSDIHDFVVTEKHKDPSNG